MAYCGAGLKMTRVGSRIVIAALCALALCAAPALAHRLTQADAALKAQTRSRSACYAKPSCYAFGYTLPCIRRSDHNVKCDIDIYRRDSTGRKTTCHKWAVVKISLNNTRPWILSLSRTWSCEHTGREP